MLLKKLSSDPAFFSKTLLKKNLSRFWPLWGGVTLVGCLAPLFLLLMLMTSNLQHIERSDFVEIFYNVLCYAIPAITLCYAVLCAMVVWSYLYSARSVGMMHTLPMDRRCLYVTGVLSGLTMMLLPYVIVGGLVILELLAFGLLPGLAALQTIAGVIAMAVFYFATATLCAMVTGHVFALPAFYFIAHFFAIGLYYLLSLFAENFLFGYTGGGTPPDAVSFLSPTVFIYQNFREKSHYNELTSKWTYELEGMWVMGVYALIGLALFVGGYLLYRRRHSESAGDVVAFRWLKPIFRYGVSVCSALTAGQLLYEIVWRIPFQRGSFYQIVPMGVCMTIAGIVGYYIASMLLAKSLRVFRRSLPGLVTVAAMVTIICSCISVDLFGVISRVPDTDQIVDLYFSANYGDSMTMGVAHPLLDDAMDLHQAIIDNRIAIRRATDNYTWEEDTDYTTVRFRYTLRDGSRVERRYTLAFTAAEWNTPSTPAGKLNCLLNNPEAIRDRYTFRDNFALSYGYFSSYYASHPNPELEDFQIELLYAALQQDLEAGNIVNADPFAHQKYAAFSLGDLQLEARRRVVRNDNYSDYEYDSVYVNVTPQMTHLIHTLMQLELLTEKDIEVALQEYEQNYAQKFEINLDPNSFPEDSLSYITPKEYEIIAGVADAPATTVIGGATSIGVIGGADGPTSIYVTGG